MNKFALKLFWRRYNSSIIYRELIRKNKFLNYEFPEQQRSLLQSQDALNLPLTFSFCGEKNKLDPVKRAFILLRGSKQHLHATVKPCLDA